MKPANNMIGIIDQVKIAPPVIIASVVFIAISIDTIDINDIPDAVFKAKPKRIWRDRTTVSRIIEVNMPLKIAKAIIISIGQSISATWKKNIVPKSPIEQPSRHQHVFLDAFPHVFLQYQFTICYFKIFVTS